MKETKAVILAAGKGTRMKSDLPKVLHTIFDKPLLQYVLDAIDGTNCINEKIVIVGHEADKVEKYATDHNDNITCILQEPQLGTGDAVNRAYKNLEGFKGNVIVVCGDTPLITKETLINFIKTHNDSNSDLTVMSAIFENPTNYGRIVRADDNSLQKIVEQKDANEEQKKIKEVNAGIYCINWEKIHNAFNELTCNNAQAEYYLTDIIAWAVSNKLKVSAYVIKNNEEIYGINSKLNLAYAFSILNKRNLEKLMTDGVSITDINSTFISSDTTIGADTIILPNVYITGKNQIGSKCKIGPFSHIRGNVTTGDFVKIGNFVEIKNSVIKSHTNVCHLSYIGDSELGEHVNIGAGTITANYNHITKVKNKTVIKNNSSTGSNSVIVAPVEIEEDCTVAAGSVVTKNVEKGALAISRAPFKIISDWFKNYDKTHTRR